MSKTVLKPCPLCGGITYSVSFPHAACLAMILASISDRTTRSDDSTDTSSSDKHPASAQAMVDKK